MIVSQSASGKSLLVSTLKKLIPQEDVISLTSLSDMHARSKELLFGVRWNTFSECINSTLRAITARLGLPRVTCHRFRRALGYHLLRAGCSVRYIQDILGHKNIRSTEIYTKVDKEDLKNVIDRFHPRAHFTKQEAKEEART